jgi:hypothetical protein
MLKVENWKKKLKKENRAIEKNNWKRKDQFDINIKGWSMKLKNKFN